MFASTQQIRPLAIMVFTFALLALPFYLPEASASEALLQGKRIAMIIGISGYDTAELHKPKKAFEAQGCAVHVVSTEKGEAVSGAGVSARVDKVIDELRVKDYDAIVFVGGGGAGYYFDHAKAHAIAHETLKENKILASICAASTILARAGVLKDRRATGYYKEPIVEHGGHYSTEFVVQDGNLITAMGPHVVKEFAEAIIQALKKV